MPLLNESYWDVTFELQAHPQNLKLSSYLMKLILKGEGYREGCLLSPDGMTRIPNMVPHIFVRKNKYLLLGEQRLQGL